MQDIVRQPQTKLIENARIIFRNFAGVEGQYNRAGDRNFGVVLTPEMAAEMEAEGWNVKYLRAREEGEEPTPWVQVSVSYKGRPPRIVMITYRGDTPNRVSLPEDMVELVDFADIANVDLILNPYSWNVSGKSGVKAYLKSLFVTISQDELERKYADIPEIDINGAPLQISATPHEDDEIIIEEEDIEDFR